MAVFARSQSSMDKDTIERLSLIIADLISGRAVVLSLQETGSYNRGFSFDQFLKSSEQRQIDLSIVYLEKSEQPKKFQKKKKAASRKKTPRKVSTAKRKPK